MTSEKWKERNERKERYKRQVEGKRQAVKGRKDLVV